MIKTILFFTFFSFLSKIIKAQSEMDSLNLKTVHSIIGTASYYSESMNGSKTATGDVFYNHFMTAASNIFKLNTWVKVTNIINDSTVLVFINDRMSKKSEKKGRVIDLSKIAAQKLNFINQGLTSVRVEPVDVNEIINQYPTTATRVN